MLNNINKQRFHYNEYILDSDVYSLDFYGSHIHAIVSLFFDVEYICKIMNDYAYSNSCIEYSLNAIRCPIRQHAYLYVLFVAGSYTW